MSGFRVETQEEGMFITEPPSPVADSTALENQASRGPLENQSLAPSSSSAPVPSVPSVPAPMLNSNNANSATAAVIQHFAEELSKNPNDTIIASTLQILLQHVPSSDGNTANMFAPAQAGRPISTADPVFRIKKQQKRGPKAKYMLDGISRDPIDFNRIELLVDCKGHKNAQVLVQWKDSGKTSWLSAEHVIIVPRLKTLYDALLETKKEAARAKRRDTALAKKRNSAPITTVMQQPAPPGPTHSVQTDTANQVSSTAVQPTPTQSLPVPTLKGTTSLLPVPQPVSGHQSRVEQEYPTTPIRSKGRVSFGTLSAAEVPTTPRKSERKRKAKSPPSISPPAASRPPRRVHNRQISSSQEYAWMYLMWKVLVKITPYSALHTYFLAT